MHYSGSKNNYHEFNEINDIRTVFWVGRSSGFMLDIKSVIIFINGQMAYLPIMAGF